MLEKLCRLCGGKNDEMVNIFNECCNEPKLSSKIEEVVHLSIMEEDPLPNVICHWCVDNIETAFQFIENCHRTQIYLTKLMQNDSLECFSIDGNLVDITINPTNCVSKLGKEEMNLSIRSTCSSPKEETSFFKSDRYHIMYKEIVSNNESQKCENIPQENQINAVEFENMNITVSMKVMCTSFSEHRINERQNGQQLENERKNHRHRLKRKCADDSFMINERICESQVIRDINDLSNDKNDDSNDSFHTNEVGNDSDYEVSLQNERNLAKKSRLSKTSVLESSTKTSHSVRNSKKSKRTKTFKDLDNVRKELRNKELLSCATCKMTFSQELVYQEHLNVHTGNRPFSCKLCEASFRKRQELNQHLRTVHSEKQIKCSLCEYVAKHKGKLTEHIKSVHEKPFVCDICNFRTGEKGKILTHIANKHTADLSYVCEICGNGFKTKISLQYHRQNIHFPEPKVCQTCGTICPSLARYNAHIFRCGKEKKRYPCEKCGQTYVNKEILRDHMNKHLNIRPYKCDVCGKEFFQRNRLDTHKYVHRGAVYRCEICNQSFKRKDNMKNHMKKHFYKSMRFSESKPTVHIDCKKKLWTTLNPKNKNENKCCDISLNKNKLQSRSIYVNLSRNQSRRT